MKRKGDQEDFNAKRIKINENSNALQIKTFSSELIIEIFKYLMLDLFHIEWNGYGGIEIKKKSDPLLPLNVIKNMMLTSKEYKNLFEICFKEMFVKEFNMDLNFKGGLLKNVIHSSILHSISLRMRNRLLMLDGNYSMVCEISVYEKIMDGVFKSIGCYGVFHELFYIMISTSLNEFICSCSMCKSINFQSYETWRDAKNVRMIG